MHWSDVERAQPRLAALARARLIEPGVVLVATIRRDGTPRLSPVEPYLMGGDLWLCMLWGSQKAADLLRDPRILVHGIVTDRAGGAGELKLRGTVWHEQSDAVQRRYAASVSEHLGWSPVPGRFHLFGVEVSHVASLRYDGPSGDQYVATWPGGAEYVRRLTSATSVGEPEPIRDVLVD